MSHHENDHAHEHHAHVTELWIYHAIFGALLVLTVITVAISRVDFGAANTLIAMFVATIKASLVALFFMHLLHDEKLNVITFTFSLLFVALYFIFPLVDITSRDRIDPLTDTYGIQKEANKLKALKPFEDDVKAKNVNWVNVRPETRLFMGTDPDAAK